MAVEVRNLTRERRRFHKRVRSDDIHRTKSASQSAMQPQLGCLTGRQCAVHVNIMVNARGPHTG
jgi:hypothetical protein